MNKPPPTPPDAAGAQDALRPPPPQWEDSSGEGAASALESLRKLEQSRSSGRPAEDRPGVD